MLAIRQTKRSSRCLARKLRTRMGQVPTRSAGTSVSNTLGNGDSGVLMVGNCSPAKIAPLSAPCYYTPTGVSKQYAFARLSKLFRNVPFLTSLEMSLFLFFVFVLVLVVGLARSEALRSP